MVSHLVRILAVVAAIGCPAIRADYLGETASISDVPSIAQVEFLVGYTWLQKCVGSILTSAHILAPATCFSGDTYSREYRRVRAGAGQRGESGQVVKVGIAYNHPNFGTLELDGDISVIRLAEILALGEDMKQVSILGQGIDLPSGLSVQLYSWGATAQGGSMPDSDLYKLTLYTKNNERCLIDYYQLDKPKIVTENMICFGLVNSGRDFDSEDVGAPLFYDNVLVAQLSFGVADNDDKIPIVGTSIGSYTTWITETAV